MVEVVFATLILMLGSLAMLSVVDASTRGNYRVEQSQVVVGKVSRRSSSRSSRCPIREVAMTAAPTSSADEDDPAWRVSGEPVRARAGRHRSRPMVVNGGGAGGRRHRRPAGRSRRLRRRSRAATSRARSAAMSSGSTTPKCPEPGLPWRPGLKRVIVAATLDNTGAGGDRAYTGASYGHRGPRRDPGRRTRCPRAVARRAPSPPSGSPIPPATTPSASRSPATTRPTTPSGLALRGPEWATLPVLQT